MKPYPNEELDRMSKREIIRLYKRTVEQFNDAVPVRHGEWLSREEGVVYPFWERYTCSVCGKHADDTDYCPHCGASMAERKEE